jgi:hypothetical protein
MSLEESRKSLQLAFGRGSTRCRGVVAGTQDRTFLRGLSDFTLISAFELDLLSASFTRGRERFIFGFRDACYRRTIVFETRAYISYNLKFVY